MMHESLESLLNKERDDREFALNPIKQTKQKVLTKSEKGASLFDFIKMIDKLITLTMQDLSVEFIPDEGKIVYLSHDQSMNHPIITYKLKDRRVKTELKPRYRETFYENENLESSRLGEIYGQKFKCSLQFNIFASSYEMCEEVLDRFETMMISYSGYFKKNGVGEILFEQQYTDDNFKNMRQTLSIRNICYYIEIEKLTVIMREAIKDVDIIT